MLRTRQVNDEVFYGEQAIIRVSASDIKWLKREAIQNQRQRVRLCTHRNVVDSTHEMLIVHARHTYVRPHRHLGKTESFHIIEGKADIVVFDEGGGIFEVIQMGDYLSGDTFYHRISDPLYHTLLIRSDVLVFHETTNGPFRCEDTVFAPWSPEGKEIEKVKAFILDLSASIDKITS